MCVGGCFVSASEWGCRIESKHIVITVSLWKLNILKYDIRALDVFKCFIIVWIVSVKPAMVLKMTIRIGRIAGVFDLECGLPAAVFGLEHRVCGPISGLITGSGEEMVAQLHESAC